MRPALALALVGLGVTAAAADARAETPPAWADVPVSAFPAAPDHDAAPKAIDASERVEGLSVERSPASRFSRKRPVTVSGADRRCVVADVDFTRDASRSDRRSSLDNLAFPVVSAVRSEQLVIAAAGKATLEIVDAWVDPETLGAREHARTSIPLAQIGRGADGTGIYAFRNRGELEMVVPVSRSSSFRAADGKIGFDDCAVARVRVGTPESAGAAVVSSPIDLPSSEGPPRTGMMDVLVSVSRVSRDPAPVLSVAVRWTPDDAELPPPPR